MVRFASVVPFAVDDRGDIKILISSEAFGEDRGKWSSFAGKFESSESPLDAASREFFEESFGLFGTRAHVRQLLKQSGVVVPSENGLHYLIQVPFDASLPHTFAGTRESVRKYVHAVTGKRRLPYAPFIEKAELAWVPLAKIPKKFRLRAGFARDIPLIRNAIAK